MKLLIKGAVSAHESDHRIGVTFERNIPAVLAYYERRCERWSAMPTLAPSLNLSAYSLPHCQASLSEAYTKGRVELTLCVGA